MNYHFIMALYIPFWFLKLPVVLGGGGGGGGGTAVAFEKILC